MADAQPESRAELRVAIAGFGTVGRKVGQALDAGISGLSLVAVSARDRVRAEAAMAEFKAAVPVEPLARLPELADVVVECLPPEAFQDIARATLGQGRILVATSVGQLLDHDALVDLARRNNGRIIVPTGALLGLDAVQAAAEGTIISVRMVTRKPPSGLAGAPYLVERGLSVDSVEALQEPLKLFEGSARDAVRAFPANVNVAAALSLAGIGPDRTMMEVWADPTIDRNTHVISVDSDSARLSLEINNIPTAENPRTGRITALSVIATLRKLTSPLQIGT